MRFSSRGTPLDRSSGVPRPNVVTSKGSQCALRRIGLDGEVADNLHRLLLSLNSLATPFPCSSGPAHGAESLHGGETRARNVERTALLQTPRRHVSHVKRTSYTRGARECVGRPIANPMCPSTKRPVAKSFSTRCPTPREPRPGIGRRIVFPSWPGIGRLVAHGSRMVFNLSKEASLVNPPDSHNVVVEHPVVDFV